MFALTLTSHCFAGSIGHIGSEFIERPKGMCKLFSKLTMWYLWAVMVIGQFSAASGQTVASFTKEADGALCVLANTARLKLQVCGENIIRVVYTMESSIPASQSLVVARSTFTPGTWDATEDAAAIVVTTPKVTATVNKATGLVSFAASGTGVCTELARTLTAVTKGGVGGYAGSLSFDSPASEGVYGLGNLSMAVPGWEGPSYWDDYTAPPDKTGQLNIRGLKVDMHQVNWMDIIPFFMTSRGYGILMNFCCHAVKTAPLNFTADFLLNNSWDYYFIYGPQFDTVISGYRLITGAAPLPPKWAFGYWQCKNRYASSAELTAAVSTFRSQNIPIDCIVQDWMWWTGGVNGRGSFAWDAPFADPSTWISTIHNGNCRFALSIWPTFSTESANYAAMEPHLIKDVVCNGTTTEPGVFMNAFDTTGLKMFWEYMKTTCFDKGVDAWWMDATEPECALLSGVNTDMGVIDQYANAYSMMHAKNIWERQRASSEAKRVVNLTRSFYAGQQRYGTMYWNGDISSDMKNVATTVAGGINSCMAGNPYWCSDIGGFMGTLTDETLVRWFEAGTFFPIFRVHGSRDTEIYKMSASARPIAVAFSRLRYRLMPYIYSLAWKVTSEGYTITRALPFDFPEDAGVLNIANQFMFGPALLVNPVTAAGSKSRSVYLPAGTWYDFWTGAANEGTAGRNVTAEAPLERIPIYARAGAILPMGPNIQYADQSVDPIELRIYPGADGSFNLYEDEGDGYGYESGSYSVIPISYSQSTGKVTIGHRTGSFPGMKESRTFNVVFVAPGKGVDTTVTATPDCVIPYSGSLVIGCPVAIDAGGRGVQHRRNLPAFSVYSAGEWYRFPAGYADVPNHIAVYSLSGRLLRSAVIKGQSFSLRRDFGLSRGTYLIRVRAALQRMQ
jgi:alpha-D-xyloside xylohydrolase